VSRKSLMSAVVRIRPDLDEFRSELRKGVNKASSEAHDKIVGELEDAGREGGKAVGDAIASGTKHGTDKAKKEFDSLEDRAKKLSTSGSKLMAVGGKMTLAVTTPIVGGFVMALNQASDLNEAINASSVIFKDAAGKMDVFASSALDNLGLARQTVLQMATPLGAMLTAQGVDVAEAERITEDLIKRGRDIKSLFNASSTEEVLQAISSGLRGESEPVRRYGVDLSEAALQAQALSAGLIKVEGDTTKVMSAQLAAQKAARAYADAVKKYGENSAQAQEAQVAFDISNRKLASAIEDKSVPALDAETKMRAAYLAIMDQSAIAEGDYARTKDGYANRLERAKEQSKELASEFGENLMPAVQKVLGFVSDLADKFNNLSEGQQNAILIGLGFAAIAGPIATVVGAVQTLMGVLTALTARWAGVTVAANTAAAAQGGATVAGGAAGAGRFALTGVAGAAGLGVGTAVLAGTAAIAAGYLINKHTGIGDGVGEWIGNLISSDGSENIPGQAEGGVTTRGGLSWVGEKGPELLSLPTGAEVRPLDKVGSTYVTMHVNVTGRAADDPKALARELDKLQRRAAATVGTRRLA
jgi:hypothetical protein